MGVCQQPKKPGKNKESHFQPLLFIDNFILLCIIKEE